MANPLTPEQLAAVQKVLHTERKLPPPPPDKAVERRNQEIVQRILARRRQVQAGEHIQ